MNLLKLKIYHRLLLLTDPTPYYDKGSVMIDLLIELLKHDIIGEVTLDDGAALQVGSQLRGHPLHDGLRRHSQICCNVLHVEDVRLDTIQTGLLLQVHLNHLVPVTNIVWLANA